VRGGDFHAANHQPELSTKRSDFERYKRGLPIQELLQTLAPPPAEGRRTYRHVY
jgi:hypothetical protein